MMKDIEELGQISLEELKAIAGGDMPVPEGLSDRVETTLGELETAEALIMDTKTAVSVAKRFSRWHGLAGIAAAAAVALAIWISGMPGRTRQPEDTFDDPALAYAAVEQALGQMAMYMKDGLGQAAKVQQVVDAPAEIFNKNNK